MIFWMIKDILEKVAKYELKNNDYLVRHLRKLQRGGGTTSIKAYWHIINNKVKRYEQTLNDEIEIILIKKVKPYFYFIIITNLVDILINILIFYYQFK